jgi:redox-sensitive bicupin YhaK (pirin superfamily)
MSTAFCYIYSGAGAFGAATAGGTPQAATEGDMLTLSPAGTTLTFSCADRASMGAAAAVPLCVLLVAGKPLREPIARHGPFVMNSRAELQTAFAEYQNGTFIKHKATQAAF